MLPRYIFHFIFCHVTEAYDKMQAELVKAREGLTKILTSKDVKATVCVLFLISLCWEYQILKPKC